MQKVQTQDRWYLATVRFWWFLPVLPLQCMESQVEGEQKKYLPSYRCDNCLHRTVIRMRTRICQQSPCTFLHSDMDLIHTDLHLSNYILLPWTTKGFKKFGENEKLFGTLIIQRNDGVFKQIPFWMLNSTTKLSVPVLTRLQLTSTGLTPSPVLG